MLVVFDFILNFLSTRTREGSCAVGSVFAVSMSSGLRLESGGNLCRRGAGGGGLPMADSSIVIFRRTNLGGSGGTTCRGCTEVVVRARGNGIKSFSCCSNSYRLSSDSVMGFGHLTCRRLSPRVRVAVGPDAGNFFLSGKVCYVVASCREDKICNGISIYVCCFFGSGW